MLLVQQWRHPVQKLLWSLPAGGMEEGETPDTAIIRELREETGFEAEHIEPLLAVATEPARHSTRAHFFFAKAGPSITRQALDSSEELEIVLVPVSELLELVERGQIVHGVHVAAILVAWRRGLLG